MASHSKQVKRLKKDAQKLWSDQQALLNRANSVARDALPHAQHAAESFVDDRVRPAAKKSAAAGQVAGKYVGSTARDAVQGTLLPAVSSAIAAALSIVDEASGRVGLDKTDAAKKGRKAAKQLGTVTKSGHRSEAKARAKLKGGVAVGRAAAKHGVKQVQKATGRKSGIGAGGVIGIVLGLVLVGGIGYAVWQTLRADDDLWVADEDPETTPTGDAPTA